MSLTQPTLSQFDLKISLIQDIFTLSSQQSQRVETQIRRAREELEQLRCTIENKNTSCMREIGPRIKQLQQKIEFYWNGVQKANEGAWKDLENQDNVLVECQGFVAKLEERLDKVQGKI